jgi:hypothetical protein
MVTFFRSSSRSDGSALAMVSADADAHAMSHRRASLLSCIARIGMVSAINMVAPARVGKLNDVDGRCAARLSTNLRAINNNIDENGSSEQSRADQRRAWTVTIRERGNQANLHKRWQRAGVNIAGTTAPDGLASKPFTWNH